MYVCKQCGTSGEEHFYTSSKSKCKKCVKDKVIQYRKDNADKVKEYDRNRPNAKDRAAKNSERLASYKENGDERYNDNMKAKAEWSKNNRIKRNAHNKTSRALYRGEIDKPLLCEHCKKDTTLEGHHHDYFKPLDVTWLCKPCHGAEHKRLNEKKRG